MSLKANRGNSFSAQSLNKKLFLVYQLPVVFYLPSRKTPAENYRNDSAREIISIAAVETEVIFNTVSDLESQLNLSPCHDFIVFINTNPSGSFGVKNFSFQLLNRNTGHDIVLCLIHAVSI